MDWDAGRCAERLLRGMPILGADSDCITKDLEYQKKRIDVLSFLNRLPDRLDIGVISFDNVLRAGNGYAPIIDGEILFIANGHISYRGSEVLAKRMELYEKINILAK
jgi:hypothetical protein